ncbi:MAG: DUF1810 domain-containing protein [Hungatella sp.]|jgi:uncharacterized protein (DUF1810 family)|nr:DUF1810 domain-containing protein [Hungatella sp.]
MADTSIKRFLDAQESDYNTALAEIRAGRKGSHWIWYIFPQIAGLGRSGTATYYAIKDMGEAREYLAHPVLRQRLLEISEALLELDGGDPLAVMGSPDDLKLRSSMTLFALAEPECEVFQKVLDKYYGGKMDKRTVSILGK